MLLPWNSGAVLLCARMWGAASNAVAPAMKARRVGAAVWLFMSNGFVEVQDHAGNESVGCESGDVLLRTGH